MPQEIYYTSASEGLRPGQRGFCTVATTLGIPRPLWDRLEAVSGYRHQFTDPAATSENPVAWAHWLLQAQGREISVLSRVCDAGLDYTQRTNAFAHHVALEPNERAAAGPAWMLGRPGVMASRWDGRVGPIARASPLPSGDSGPAPCHAWQRAAGDAGWAGVLAEAGVKHPRKPVCILYSPGLDLLPLMAEAIALLPSAKRWDISFNTYFTGLPGNVVCAWRCCLANTPAANEAARHAAGGLLVDLSRPDKLGVPPAGQWVDMARAGRGGVIDVAPARSNWTRVRHPSAPAESPATDPPPFPVEEPVYETLAAAPSLRAAPVRTSAVTSGQSRALDTSWSERQRKSRLKLLVALAALALLFVAAGIWLRLAAQQATVVHPLPVPATREAQPDPLVIVPDALIPPPVNVDPTPAAVRPSPTPVLPSAAPAVAGDPAPPAVTPAPPAPPPPIVLAAELSPPVATGAGLKDPAQSFLLPADQSDSLRSAAGLKVSFPGQTRAFAMRSPGLTGTLTVDVSPRSATREIISWRDGISRANPIEVATLSFEPPRPGAPAKVEISWRTNSLLRHPDVTAVARAVLQHSELLIPDARPIPPRSVSFKPANPAAIDVSAASCALAVPPIPPGVTFRGEQELPDGWIITWSRDAAGRPGDAASGLLQFDRPSLPGRPATQFALRISPDWSTVASNWVAQRTESAGALVRAQAELSKAESELAKIRESNAARLDPLEKELAAANIEYAMNNRQLADRFTNRKDAKARLDRAQIAFDSVRAQIEPDQREAQARRDAAEAARAGYDAAIGAFDHLKDARIAIELPEKLRVATLVITIGKP